MLIKYVRERLLPNSVITGALLEFEPIPNLQSRVFRQQSFRSRSQPHAIHRKDTKQIKKPIYNKFIQGLDDLYDLAHVHGIDSYGIWSIFYQSFYFICTSALNALLLRKDLCNWSRGAQIRFNLANLETWLSEKNLIPDPTLLMTPQTSFTKTKEMWEEIPNGGKPLRDLLDPLIQACLLLQSKKGCPDETTLRSICEHCPQLTIAQIMKLLKMYTPVSGYDEPFPLTFLQAVNDRLREIRGQSKSLCFGVPLEQSALLLECTYQLPNPLLSDFQISDSYPLLTLENLPFPAELDLTSFITYI